MIEKKKAVGKLGTFNNNGLTTGLSFFHFSESQMKEIEAFISKKEIRIAKDFEKHIHRLENFLKEEFKVIPRSDDFAVWFFDKRTINGSGLDITDDEIFEYTEIYLKELVIKTQLSKRQAQIDDTFDWKGEISDLEKMYKGLKKENFISRDTTFDDMKAVFGAIPNHRRSIVWSKKSTRNKYTNKKSLYVLFSILEGQNKITTTTDAVKFKLIADRFIDDLGKPIVLMAANRPSVESPCEYFLEIKNILE